MKIKVRLRTISVCLLVLCVAGALSRLSTGVRAQKQDKPKTAHPTAPAKIDSKVNTGPNNAAYAAKVKEYTTESYFMTELVDHLPASDKIPSPDRITGYEVGAPGHLTYSKDLYRYYRELEKTTPRVRVLLAGKRLRLLRRTDHRGRARFVVRPPRTERRLRVRALGLRCRSTSITVRR